MTVHWLSMRQKQFYNENAKMVSMLHDCRKIFQTEPNCLRQLFIQAITTNFLLKLFQNTYKLNCACITCCFHSNLLLPNCITHIWIFLLHLYFNTTSDILTGHTSWTTRPLNYMQTVKDYLYIPDKFCHRNL